MKYVDENALRQNISETKDYVDTHGFASDRTPIGTIISVGCDSSLIPSSTIKYPTDDYFICKGTTLNIAEYPALADYFEDAFGSKNYFGGDGTTTFKVPDFTADFPINGILVIKAQIESTTITYVDVDDTRTSNESTWSSEKIAERTGGDSGVPFIFDSTHHVGSSFDCNSLASGLSYVAKECANTPFNNFWSLILTFKYSDLYVQQLALPMGGNQQIAFRKTDDGFATSSSWNYINFDS